MARGRGGYRGTRRWHSHHTAHYPPRGRGRGRPRVHAMPTDRSFYQRNRDGTKLTLVRPKTTRALCRFFLRGACTAGRACLYSHAERRLCPLFVGGRCPAGGAGASCPRGAHAVSEFNAPVCEGFLQGVCARGGECALGHVYKGLVACSAFAEFGVCAEGGKCPKMHAMFCPRFGGKEGCPDPLCRMPHRSGAERLLGQKGVIEVPEGMEREAAARFKWTRPAKRGRVFGKEEIRKARKEQGKPDGRFFSPANIAMVTGEFMSLEVTPEEMDEGMKSFMEREERRKSKQRVEYGEEGGGAGDETQDEKDIEADTQDGKGEEVIDKNDPQKDEGKREEDEGNAAESR